MSGVTLTEFLLARITEDEAAARLVMNSGDPYPWELRTDGNELCIDRVRVLAECEAKRRIVAALAAHDHTGDLAPESRGALFVKREVCRMLAAVYADHPDYDNTWSPA